MPGRVSAETTALTDSHASTSSFRSVLQDSGIVGSVGINEPH
jgi:hypothetical protein